MQKIRVNKFNDEAILNLIKKLVSYIIAKENNKIDNQNFSKEYTEILKSKFLKYKKEDILYLILRHRLLPLLFSSNLTDIILPNLKNEIKSLSRKEFYRTLFISSKLLEIANFLNLEKIPFIVIKGIPLSIQTTNNLISRGSGDIDIFIDPSLINKVCAILEERGFKKSFPNINYSKSIIGRYITFVSPEVKFQKNYFGNNFLLDIDIHWRLSWIKGPTPSFRSAWNNKTQIMLNGQSINVLSVEDAFIHSCLHAAQDEFMSIRSLLDIERLSRKIDKKKIHKLSRLNVVRNASCVSFDCTKGDSLKFFYNSRNTYFQYLINKSRILQLSEWKYMSTSVWSVNKRIRVGFRILQFTKNPVDWLRVLSLNFLKPESFFNYEKNQIIYNPFKILALRFKKLLEKIRESLIHKL